MSSTGNISPTTQNNLKMNSNSIEPRLNGTVSNAIDGKNSPLPISSMLHILSMGSNGSLPNNMSGVSQAQYLLKLSNLPNDLSLREAHAIFSLLNGNVSVEVINVRTSEVDHYQKVINARFESLPLVSHCAAILNSKSSIFGPEFPFNLVVDILDEITNQHIPVPNLVREPNYQLSNAVVPPLTGIPVSSGGQGSIPQKSRFSFSETFNNDNSQNQATIPSSHNPSTHDLTMGSGLPASDVGKSFLMMGNDEINDSIWGSTGITSIMNGFTSSPQSSTPNLDWSSPNDRKPSGPLYVPHGLNNNMVPSHSMDSIPQMQGVHRISQSNPSGAIPLNKMAPYGMISQAPVGHPQQIPNNTPANASDMGVAPQKRSSFTQVASGQQSQFQQEILNNNELQPISSSSTPQKIQPLRSSISKNIGIIKDPSASSSSSNVASSTGISQADLSLLARVPPPANPADQNPPCNTLYVGNLPPDATEQELRQLFANQQGFRRLSFRNKNSNGNGHGPMCFVEFDDVSFATVALAELYGSQLPRATISNKGGIRLSFSKNPLGVRGPNNRRIGNSNPSTGSSSTPTTGSSNSTSNSNNNYSYIIGYTKN